MPARLRSLSNLFILHQIINGTWFPLLSRWNSRTTPRNDFKDAVFTVGEKSINMSLMVCNPLTTGNVQNVKSVLLHRPRSYKTSSMLNSAEHEIYPAQNVKIQTIVCILTFISMINTTSERLKAINFFICRYFSFYEQLKFRAQLSWAWKKFYNLVARFHILYISGNINIIKKKATSIDSRLSIAFLV